MYFDLIMITVFHLYDSSTLVIVGADIFWIPCASRGLFTFKLQVPLPEKPDTEDESILKKWRWEVKSAKKENSERHSQRCDIELKLSVSFIPPWHQSNVPF